MTSDCDTPAAIKRLIPDPMPHFVDTSSMNMTSIPPRQSCAMSKSWNVK